MSVCVLVMRSCVAFGHKGFRASSPGDRVPTAAHRKWCPGHLHAQGRATTTTTRAESGGGAQAEVEAEAAEAQAKAKAKAQQGLR